MFNILELLIIVPALSAIIVLTILSLIDWKSNNIWFCEKMGWHKPPERVGFDGCSMEGFCPRCGKHVLRDSQGNWF
jgi:hypothetical protein